MSTLIYLIDPTRRKVKKIRIPEDRNPLPVIDGLIRGNGASLRNFTGDRIYADLHRDVSAANLPFLVKNGGLVFGNAVIVGIGRNTPKNSIWQIRKSVKFYRYEEAVKEYGRDLHHFRWDGYRRNERIKFEEIQFWRRLFRRRT